MVFRTFLLLVGLLAVAFAVSAARGGERVFFAFDDHALPWQHNLKLTLAQAEKHPENPVLRRGPKGAPDHGHAILYGTVLKEGDRFRMWYLGMFEPEILNGQAPGWWRPMCYAESDDGVHWSKPALGLVDFNGDRQNNICLIEGEPFSMTRVNDFLSVLRDADDPDPARRYKAAFIAHVPYDDIPGGMSAIGTKERRVAVTVLATSADGLSWKIAGPPANAGGERFEVSSLYRFGDFYYSTGQLISPWTWRADGSETGRTMLTYRSADFDRWSPATARGFSRPGQLANPPVPGQQTHMGAGMWNRGNVMMGLYGMWQDAPKKPESAEYWNRGVSVDLGLIVSNDGVHFREPVPGFKVVARGEPGAWDDTALLQGHAFVNEGDRTMIWYSHWDTGGKLKSMEIGLATLRRDGFGYLSSQVAENDAEVVTDFFPATEKTSVFLNIEGATTQSPVEIEWLDEKASPVAGARASVVESGLRVPVSWKIPPGAGERRAMRLIFPKGSPARLHAIYLED